MLDIRERWRTSFIEATSYDWAVEHEHIAGVLGRLVWGPTPRPSTGTSPMGGLLSRLEPQSESRLPIACVGGEAAKQRGRLGGARARAAVRRLPVFLALATGFLVAAVALLVIRHGHLGVPATPRGSGPAALGSPVNRSGQGASAGGGVGTSSPRGWNARVRNVLSGHGIGPVVLGERVRAAVTVSLVVLLRSGPRMMRSFRVRLRW